MFRPSSRLREQHAAAAPLRAVGAQAGGIGSAQQAWPASGEQYGTK